MANTNEKLKVLKSIHQKEEALYAERNQRYGDSFSSTYNKRGPAALLIRLEDKLSRVDNLLSNGLMESDGESVIDTLMDLSNYANMGIMELMGQMEGEKASKKKKPKKDTPNKESKEGPLDSLSKKQLVEVVSQLGGTVPKKANREKLMEAIHKYPMADIAMAITSLGIGNSDSSEEDTDEEEE